MFLRSERICPLILWIWLSVIFVVLALAEYFVILLTIKFKGRKVNDKLYEWWQDNYKTLPKCVEALATKGRDEKLEVWTLSLDRFVLKNQPEICWILFHPMFQDNSDHLAHLLSDDCCALFPHLRLVVGQCQVDKIRPSENLMFRVIVLLWEIKSPAPAGIYVLFFFPPVVHHELTHGTPPV